MIFDDANVFITHTNKLKNNWRNCYQFLKIYQSEESFTLFHYANFYPIIIIIVIDFDQPNIRSNRIECLIEKGKEKSFWFTHTTTMMMATISRFGFSLTLTHSLFINVMSIKKTKKRKWMCDVRIQKKMWKY